MIRFENVGLRYGMGPEVLRDLTFQIEPKSFQFLTGPSGAGKTTLIRLFFLALRPTRGLLSLLRPRRLLASAAPSCLRSGGASASSSRISACSTT